MYSRKGTTLFCLPSLRETQQSNLFLCVSWSEITGKEIKHCQLALRSPLCIPQMTLAGCIGVLSPVHLQPLSHTGKSWHDMGESSQGPVLNLSWFCSIIRSSTHSLCLRLFYLLRSSPSSQCYIRSDSKGTKRPAINSKAYWRPQVPPRWGFTPVLLN